MRSIDSRRCETYFQASSFSPCGRRWREATDEGCFYALLHPSSALRAPSPTGGEGTGLSLRVSQLTFWLNNNVGEIFP